MAQQRDVAHLPGWRHTYSGKVRDLYADEADARRVLVVASDRISAYDHVLPTPIPDKPSSRPSRSGGSNGWTWPTTS